MDGSLRPMLVSTAQSTALYAISNVLGQIIEGWRRSQPLRFNWAEFVRFVIATTLLNPPCFYWQFWMETNWPGEKDPAGAKGKDAESYLPVPQDFELDDLELQTEGEVHGERASLEDGRGMRRRSGSGIGEEERGMLQQVQQNGAEAKGKSKMNWRNVFIKWVLDNSLGGLWYTVGFVFLIELFKFKGLKAVGQALVSVSVNQLHACSIANNWLRIPVP